MKILGMFLLVFLFPTSTYANELRLYFLRSPLGINWQSPWKMTVSTLKNQVFPTKYPRGYRISHVFAEIRCDSNGRQIFRGMTSKTNDEERDLILNKKYGLGVMFHTYAGLYEKNESILADLGPYKGSKRRAELSIRVSAEACERMQAYADEYEDLGYGQMYSGLQADPLKREGAGCSAFAVSFMRVGGLMDDFTDEWKQIIDVPKYLVGGPLTGNKVNLLTILNRPFAQWSSKRPHIHLEAWDPEKMHAWVQKVYRQIEAGTYDGKWPASTSRYGNTLHVELDMENRQTPSGSFWL